MPTFANRTNPVGKSPSRRFEIVCDWMHGRYYIADSHDEMRLVGPRGGSPKKFLSYAAAERSIAYVAIVDGRATL